MGRVTPTAPSGRLGDDGYHDPVGRQSAQTSRSAPMTGLRRVARVAQIMGLPISIHVIAGTSDPALDEVVDDAAARAWERLHDVDALFSTYRPDSQVSRIRRAELLLENADPRVAAVAQACEHAELATRGLFSAFWDGTFDPTGYVKGWAIEGVGRDILVPLLPVPGVVAAGINGGGDMQLFTTPGADWEWRVGIEDPTDPARIVATVTVADGAVATSGIAHRGRHIIDPRTGAPATGALAATVVADALSDADVWATAAVVAGDLDWIRRAPARGGLLVAADGTVRRWAAGVEVTGFADTGAPVRWPPTG